jgi:hypothetical protein
MIELTRRGVLAVEPKDVFVERMSKHSDALPYFAEENSVYLIPDSDSFESDAQFDEYITSLKPKLLLRELCRFLVSDKLVVAEAGSMDFDEYFEVVLRDYVASIEELDSWIGGLIEKA